MRDCVSEFSRPSRGGEVVAGAQVGGAFRGVSEIGSSLGVI